MVGEVVGEVGVAGRELEVRPARSYRTGWLYAFPVRPRILDSAPATRMVGFFGTDDGGANFGSPVVSSVGARCQALVGGPITTVGPAPGSGPAFGPFDCPAGQVVVAAQGRSGAVVDSLGLACKTVP